MFLRMTGVALLIGLASCVPTNQSIEASGTRQVEAERKVALRRLEHVKNAWAFKTKEAAEKWQPQLVYPICDKTVPAGTPCGLVAQQYEDPTFRAHFATTWCDDSEEGMTEACAKTMIDTFVSALRERYKLEPSEYCANHSCSSYTEVELGLLKTHNDSIMDSWKAENARIDAEYQGMLDVVVNSFDRVSARINEDTEQRLDRAERQRSALQGLAAGMHAAGESLSQSNAQTPNPVAVASPAGCANDYGCGYGNACVKDSGSFRGICAKSVNAYGNPTFAPPRLESNGPGVGNCSFDTDCSVGFRCIKSNGGLRGNCMK